MNRRLLAQEPTLFSFVYQASPKNVSIQQATQAIRNVMLASEVVDKKTEILPKTELTWSEDLYVGSNSMIALAVVGGVVFVVVLILVYCCCCRKKSGNREQSESKEPTNNPRGAGTGEPLVIPITIEYTKDK